MAFITESKANIAFKKILSKIHTSNERDPANEPESTGFILSAQNIWGEEIELPGGVFRQWLPYKWAKATEDPVELELEKLRIYPGKPRQKVTIDGKPTELDEDIYKNYCLLLGKKLKVQIAKTIESPFYKRIEDIEKRKKLLNRKIRSIRFRELARAKREQIKKRMK